MTPETLVRVSLTLKLPPSCFQSSCTSRQHRKVFFTRLCFSLLFFPPTLSKDQRPEADLDAATPFAKQILSVNGDIFFMQKTSADGLKLRTGQGDSTSLLSLSSGGASDLLDRALAAAKEQQRVYPHSLPYALLLFSTAVTQLSYSPLFVMCQGPTRGGDSGEKLSLRSQSNVF